MTENAMKQQKQDTGDTMLRGYREDECFALKVADDGFTPSILPEDIVIVHKQPDVEDGELAVIMVDGDTNAVLRRVRRYDNGRILLTVDNSAPAPNKRYEPIVIDCNESYRVHVLGKVVSLMRDMTNETVKREIENAWAAEDVNE